MEIQGNIPHSGLHLLLHLSFCFSISNCTSASLPIYRLLLICTHVHCHNSEHVCAAQIDPGLLEVPLVLVCVGVCLCESMQVGLSSPDHLSVLR